MSPWHLPGLNFEFKHVILSQFCDVMLCKSFKNTDMYLKKRCYKIRVLSFLLGLVENKISPPCLELRPHKRVARAPAEVTTLTISIAPPPSCVRVNSRTQLCQLWKPIVTRAKINCDRGPIVTVGRRDFWPDCDRMRLCCWWTRTGSSHWAELRNSPEMFSLPHQIRNAAARNVHLPTKFFSQVSDRWPTEAEHCWSEL